MAVSLSVHGEVFRPLLVGGTAVLLAPEVMYVRGLNIRSTSNSFLHMF